MGKTHGQDSRASLTGKPQTVVQRDACSMVCRSKRAILLTLLQRRSRAGIGTVRTVADCIAPGSAPASASSAAEFLEATGSCQSWIIVASRISHLSPSKILHGNGGY